MARAHPALGDRRPGKTRTAAMPAPLPRRTLLPRTSPEGGPGPTISRSLWTPATPCPGPMGSAGSLCPSIARSGTPSTTTFSFSEAKETRDHPLYRTAPRRRFSMEIQRQATTASPDGRVARSASGAISYPGTREHSIDRGIFRQLAASGRRSGLHAQQDQLMLIRASACAASRSRSRSTPKAVRARTTVPCSRSQIAATT